MPVPGEHSQPVKMKWKSFMAHLPGPLLTQTFHHCFPHLTQNKTDKVTYATVFSSCNSSRVTSARVWQRNVPYPASRHLRTLTGTALLLPQQPGHSRERESVTPAMQESGRTSSYSVPGNSPCHAMDAPGEFCAPQQQSPLYCRKEHAVGFFSSFRCEHSGKWAQTRATWLLQTAQPKKTQKDPTGKIRDTSIGVSPLLPPKNDQHKHDNINKK